MRSTLRSVWFSMGVLTLLPAFVVELHGDDDESSEILPPRAAWTTSRVRGYPDPPLPFTVQPAYHRLPLEKPLAAGKFPDPGHDLMWVITHRGGFEGPGAIYLFTDQPEAEEAELFLERPEIIYGIAFHPEFAINRYVFVGCNGPSDAAGGNATRVIRFTVTRQPPFRCDPESARVILEWASDGHNGGDLDFGPDGMLYVSAGDGTSDSDVNDAGQDLSTLNGAILRIDVNAEAGEQPYSVPADNPFLETPGARPEIWAYGLRNPWRLTYDHEGDQLWAGNNGQDLWETAHLVRRGENYGWSVLEGSHPFQLERQRGPTAFTPPTIEHPHSEARSLTGGVVYRGAAIPELYGAYIYGDYSTGDIWAALHDGASVLWRMPLARTKLKITGFGVNGRGELIVVDHAGGLNTLVRQTRPADGPIFPRLLSETGIFADVRLHQPHPGLLPYEVNAPLWSDGASKLRLLGLPPGGQVDFHETAAWNFPEGTVLVKTFSLPVVTADGPAQQRIETRLLTLQEGEWVGYSYEWRDDQSDASLVEAPGKDRQYIVRHQPDGADELQVWRFPSRAECMMCHSRAANFVLGVSTRQLNRDHTFDNGIAVNQLHAWRHWGVFAAKETGDNEPFPAAPHDVPAMSVGSVDLLPRLADPYDALQPLDARVRAYFDSNCANCHVEAGGGNSRIDLYYTTPFAMMRIIDVVPQHDRMGVSGARLVAPGDANRSILLRRMSIRGRGQMPPLATHRIDDAAVELIRGWINGLDLERERLPGEGSGH